MSECRCYHPPFSYLDYETENVGVDERYGEVSVETCRYCGTRWLRYAIEFEAFTRSGRWYRGLIGADEAASMRPELAVRFFERLPWYFAGGSDYATSGIRMTGPIRVDP